MVSEQSVAVPLVVPPTAAGLTVIVVKVDVSVHEPFVNTAQYTDVCVRLLYVKLVVVLATFVQLLPPFIERIHFDTLPVCPLNVIVPVFVPEHTAVLPVVVPPTAGVTVIVTDEELPVQVPFCTTALNIVV